MERSTFQVHSWVRHPANPVLPSGGGDFDATACMNPMVIRQGATYYLFYAGGDREGRRQICLATAPVEDVTCWTRLGPVLERGAAPDAFDHFWCVLPMVHRFGERWHLYWTGRNDALGGGLQAFTGIGLATSTDLIHWERYGDGPILHGDHFPMLPRCRAIAGGARIEERQTPEGRTLYRLHYTKLVGRPDADQRVDQEKHSACASSYDGISWFDHRLLLSPREEADYENAATIALNTWKVKRGYRALYAGIGSRFGAYSICEAASIDGEVWERGAPGENLALAPEGEGWESEMTAYPNVIIENGSLRLFYCGNGYGATGIGTALAAQIVD